MKSVFNYIIKVSFVVAFLVITPIAIFARDFVVVIDAGHGGKDCGAVGEYAQEKYGEIGMVSGDTARSISFVIKDLLENEEK